MLLIILWSACNVNRSISLEPNGFLPKDTVQIHAGALKAIFIDNKKWGEMHRAGYNGIAELYHTKQDSNVFVPFYAGFNLEHIFNGDSLVDFFEPRQHPMTLFRKSSKTAVLYQKPTPISGVESLTEFTLRAPHYIDITFQCIFHKPSFIQHDYAGLFWASYIDQPADRSIYFRGIEKQGSQISWIKAFSDLHGTKSTHRNSQDDFGFFFAKNFNATLANHFSEYRFSHPFYFGKFHNMVLAFLFDTSETIRFSQSPTGGGKMNPAWDFQFLINSPKMEQIYSFQVRLIYKPFLNQEEILKEYTQWKK